MTVGCFELTRQSENYDRGCAEPIRMSSPAIPIAMGPWSPSFKTSVRYLLGAVTLDLENGETEIAMTKLLVLAMPFVLIGFWTAVGVLVYSLM
jgi:hypothetical protein